MSLINPQSLNDKTQPIHLSLQILLFKERDVTASPGVQKMSGGFQHMGIPVPCSPTLAPNVSTIDNNNRQDHKSAATQQEQFVMPAAPVAISRAQHQNNNNFVSDTTNIQVSFSQASVPNIISFPLNAANFQLKDGLQMITTNPNSQTGSTVQYTKPFNGGSVSQIKEQHKQQVISDIAASLAEDKPADPLMISTPVTYQDGGGGQPSPASSTQSITTQVMRFQASDNVSDAMLSAINYNDNEILPADNFDGNLAVDEQLLTMRNNMNTPSGSVFGDLFDGDSNMGDYNIEGPQDPSLSPQSFSGLTDSGSLGLDQDAHTGKFPPSVIQPKNHKNGI